MTTEELYSGPNLIQKVGLTHFGETFQVCSPVIAVIHRLGLAGIDPFAKAGVAVQQVDG